MRMPSIVSITGAICEHDSRAALTDVWRFVREEQDRRLRSVRVFDHSSFEVRVYWAGGAGDSYRVTAQVRR